MTFDHELSRYRLPRAPRTHLECHDRQDEPCLKFDVFLVQLDKKYRDKGWRSSPWTSKSRNSREAAEETPAVDRELHRTGG